MEQVVGGSYKMDHCDMFDTKVRAVRTCEQRTVVSQKN